MSRSYCHCSSYGTGQQSVRAGDWKAVRQNLQKGGVKTELYNIATDISEKQDVAAQHPDVTRQLQQLMAEQHVRSDMFPLRAIDGPAAAKTSKK